MKCKDVRLGVVLNKIHALGLIVVVLCASLGLAFAGYVPVLSPILLGENSNNVSDGESPVPTLPTTSPTPVTNSPSPPPVNMTQVAVDEAISRMNATISRLLNCMKGSYTTNPQANFQLQDKIALLQDTNLPNKIINGGFFAVDYVSSMDGRQLPILAIYPEANMRTEAIQAIQYVKNAIPVLESFMDCPYRMDWVHIWYGFSIGSSGDLTGIFMEDRSPYEWRMSISPAMLPYEPGFYHELAHGYIGHESLTQFLETYVYNVLKTKSYALQDWDNFRDRQTYPGHAALLDIYQLIGRDSMANAYRTIFRNCTPYGEILSQEGKQAFVDQAPADLKSRVSELASSIKY
jgi:hypothetical protein